MRASAARACSFPERRRSPWRAASRATTSAPALWRVPSYSAPGFPRPTTSRSAGVPRLGAARTGTGSALGRGLALAGGGLGGGGLGALGALALLALDGGRLLLGDGAGRGGYHGGVIVEGGRDPGGQV